MAADAKGERIASSPRILMTVILLDGRSIELNPTGEPQVGPGFLLIPLAKKSVGFSLFAIQSWEVELSPIALGKLS